MISMLIESPIHSRHASNDAFFLPYGPEDSPIAVVETFGDLDMEYASLRKGAVLFDTPHRGTIQITGADRLAYLNNMVTNKVLDLTTGMSRPCFWLNRKGRIDADLVLSEHENEMLITVDRHLAKETAETLSSFVFAEDVEIVDVSDSMHRLHIHGPTAMALLNAAADQDNLDLAEYANTTITIDRCPVHAYRMDLTGEIGISMCIKTDDAIKVYEHLLKTGESDADLRVRETGWLALNAARIEAGSPMFNIDFGSANVPAETGIIDKRVAFDKGCYLGQEVVARMHARKARKQTIVALRIENQQITTDHTDIHQPTSGSQVFANEESPTTPVGSVTSSTISPMLGAIPVCFAMVKDAHTAPGTKLRVLAEGTLVDAVVQPQLAFYSKPENRLR